MKKIKQIEAIKSTTMFLLDENIEHEFDELVTKKVKSYQKAMIGIGTEEGLRSFIVNNADSIEMLETVLGISGERMKRVVTMIRVNKGYTFDTEWSETKLQKELAADEQLLTEYCELFLKGRELDKYKRLIPKFILDDFCIDENIISRVTNSDILTKLFKKKNDTTYTSRYSTYYFNKVKEEVSRVVSSFGLSLETGDIEGVAQGVQYLTNGEKYIIITFNYSLTTGQGQTDYHRKKIQPIYQGIRKKDNIVLVNLLDGAGWVGRSADFKKTYNDCNYFANLNRIDIIGELAKEFFNIQ